MCFAAALAMATISMIIFSWLSHGGCIEENWFWDIPFTIDGAWRLWNGQVPHRDFYCHMGALIHYIPLWGMYLRGFNVEAINYGYAIMTVATAFIAILFLARRTSAFNLFLWTCFWGVLVITPRTLGTTVISRSGQYNRLSEALVGLLALWLFLPLQSSEKRKGVDWLETILASVILTALFFLKFSYFVVGAGLVALAVILRTISLAKLLGLTAGFIMVCKLALWATHIPLESMLADFRIMMRAQNANSKITALLNVVMQNSLLLLMLGTLAWVSSLGVPKKTWIDKWRSWLPPLAFLGSGVALASTNSMQTEVPFAFFAFLWIAEEMSRQKIVETPMLFCRNCLVFCIMLAVMLPTLFRDQQALAHKLANQEWGNKSQTLEQTNLKKFPRVTRSGATQQFLNYRTELEEAMDMLNKYKTPAMRLSVMDTSNPFAFALGITPATGGSVFFYNNVLNGHSHPAFGRMLGDATHLLINEHGQFFDAIPAVPVYAAELHALNLEVLVRGKYYTLYKLPVGQKSIQH